MNALSLMILSWFGSGYSPKAPGTVGSLAALPFAWVIATYGGSLVLIASAVLIFLLGWGVAAITPQAQSDPGWVVIDEVAGIWLTLAVVPPDVMLYAIGFVLFRFFDILKPWPIRTLERSVPGALGVMLDDIAAGVFAAALLYGSSLLLGT